VRAGPARLPAVDRPQIDRARARGERFERALDVGAPGSRSDGKAVLERSVARDHLPENPQHAGEILAAGPAMHDRPDRRASRSGSKLRTNAPGAGPIAAQTASIDAITDATRPNASPAATNATTSRSSRRS
jgi:hypothetical protein